MYSVSSLVNVTVHVFTTLTYTFNTKVSTPFLHPEQKNSQTVIPDGSFPLDIEVETLPFTEYNKISS